jgi:hypothetical protein
MTPRDETEVVGFQFDQVEERNADYEEPDNDADGAECQGRRADREQGFKPSHRLRPMGASVRQKLTSTVLFQLALPDTIPEAVPLLPPFH